MKKGELPDRLTAFLQVSECLPEPPGFEPPHLAEEICRERLEEIPVEGHLPSCGHLGTPKPEIPRAKPTFAVPEQRAGQLPCACPWALVASLFRLSSSALAGDHRRSSSSVLGLGEQEVQILLQCIALHLWQLGDP